MPRDNVDAFGGAAPATPPPDSDPGVDAGAAPAVARHTVRVSTARSWAAGADRLAPTQETVRWARSVQARLAEMAANAGSGRSGKKGRGGSRSGTQSEANASASWDWNDAQSPTAMATAGGSMPPMERAPTAQSSLERLMSASLAFDDAADAVNAGAGEGHHGGHADGHHGGADGADDAAFVSPAMGLDELDALEVLPADEADLLIMGAPTEVGADGVDVDVFANFEAAAGGVSGQRGE